jgi:hypothetical protein
MDDMLLTDNVGSRSSESVLDKKTRILISGETTNTQGKYTKKVYNIPIFHSPVPEFKIRAIHPCYNTKRLTKELQYLI